MYTHTHTHTHTHTNKYLSRGDLIETNLFELLWIKKYYRYSFTGTNALI